MRFDLSKIAIVVLTAASLGGVAAAQRVSGHTGPPLDFPNASFEQGLDEWMVAPGSASLVGVTRVRASEGVHSLTIVDNDAKRGAIVTGPRVVLPIEGRGTGRFALFAKIFPQTGSGLVLSVRLRGAGGELLHYARGDYYRVVPRYAPGNWTPVRLTFSPPPEAVTAEVVVSTDGRGRVTACLDDFIFVPVADPKPKTPPRRTLKPPKPTP